LHGVCCDNISENGEQNNSEDMKFTNGDPVMVSEGKAQLCPCLCHAHAYHTHVYIDTQGGMEYHTCQTMLSIVLICIFHAS